MTRSYAGRSAAQRQAERRERLLAAGVELIGTRGYAATSIDALCAMASVSTRTFYEEFATREDLLIDLHATILTKAREAVAMVFEQAPNSPWQQRIESGVVTFLEVMAQDPRHARVAFVEIVGVSPAVEEHRLRWRDIWLDVIVAEGNRAAGRGEVRMRPLRLGAMTLVAAVNELGQHCSRHPEDRDAVVQELVRVAIGLLDQAPGDGADGASG